MIRTGSHRERADGNTGQPYNRRYMLTKQQRMGHKLHI